MINFDIRTRLGKLWWWIGSIALLINILACFGIDATQYIGKDWQNVLTLVFGFLAWLGINVDTSTKGFNDVNKLIAEITPEENNTDIKKQTEQTTTAINSEVTTNSLDDIVKIQKIKDILQQ